MMKMTDNLLFAKYATPCGHKHVEKGSLTQKELDNSITLISREKDVPESTLKVYDTALKRCEQIANKLKLREINGLVIREYFLRYHNKLIEKKCALKKSEEGFNPDECKVKLGRIAEILDKRAMVDLKEREKYCRTDFVPNLKVDDMVSVHYDFIVEILGPELVKKYFS
jgi:hypothetical protein